MESSPRSVAPYSYFHDYVFIRQLEKERIRAERRMKELPIVFDVCVILDICFH